ncbi:methyltransferase family protein [Nonomuraea endophytica]|uniref:Protein-S-isoprenylcysteine O-methyltransferase Ste14 n=1 Tax=Nonomuraea endophytica TaxID=714136 RepID=A0A7W8EGM4_9ACTN|nr:methyltransferase [Nonomuraea endophytica]MBB5077697.1 protein-S-isoprenylcysteine O-methyltransferase Ste14 [Nonomuraea endophytica]
MSATLIRGLGLMLPLAAVLVAALLAARADRLGPPRIAAAILATGWNAMVLMAVNQSGWWTFHAEGGTLAGVPLDLLLGWALLWGALPALAFPEAPLALGAAGLAWFDLAVMPMAEPVVVLGPDWLIGETVAVGLALVPGLLLIRWTVRGTLPLARAGFQVVLAVGLGVVAPVLLLGAWRQPAWVLALMAQVLAVPFVMGASAVREFARTGGGTPFPYDPPRRLVTGGPYAYVRNPMQVAMTAGYVLLAVLDVRFLAAAAISFAYGAGLAAWHEGEQLTRRFGAGWAAYRAAVRAWLPRWRPAAVPATVYVAATCGQCSQVGAWIERRGPVALRVVAAETHPAGLRRITYERADGLRAQGVAAIAHVLTHVHLGWALAGWLLQLPCVNGFAQLCVDAFGGGPRELV